MLNLNNIIAEYLQSNRRLVIPDFGAFITKDSGEVVFSALLRNDDGVLASLLASHGLNNMEIAVTIDRYKFEVRHALQEFGYCKLDSLGTLRLEPESNTLKLYHIEGYATPSAAKAEPKPEAPQAIATPQPTVIAKVQTESREIKSSTTPQAGFVVDTTPTKSIKTAKPKRVDTIIVLAIVILLGALGAIGYGYYVSRYTTESDDARIEVLRHEVREEANRE